ncbi:hypothetical protein PVK06_011826 [Gossypium arboreum]|uniref:Uncharacterized protein n=1 Tax=Gossypium arboreum TaxID=29729 RepID=A0ABR0QAS8_GOSAR|nr:hypothetical protein PVK06_011826 [Gossypium arboreum]
MTRGKDTSILKEAKTSKTRKDKAKADRKGTNLNAKTSLWCKLKDVKKMVNSFNNRAWNNFIVATFGQLSPSPLSKFPVFPPIIQNYDLSSSDDDLKDRDRLMASTPIVQVSDNEKEEEFRDIKECLRKIDSLFEGGIFPDQEDTIVEKEVATTEEEVAKNEKKEEEEEDFVKKIFTAPESVGANIDNLEQAGARPAEFTEVTSEEQCNSLAIVVYTGPLQVASPTQEAVGDAKAEPGTGEQSENHAKPKEKKKKCSKDKK